MSGVVDSVPEEMRELFAEIIGRRDAKLYFDLCNTEKPTPIQLEEVMDILLDEFLRNLQTDYEPTKRGKAIDDLLGAINMRWIIQK